MRVGMLGCACRDVRVCTKQLKTLRKVDDP